MRLGSILTILTVLCTSANAGEYSIRVEAGYGDYAMKSLHSLQNYMREVYQDNGISVKQTESFPAYYFTKFSLIYHTANSLNWGICGDYASTGGRLVYSDYSGELTADQIVYRYTIGLHAEYEYPVSGIFSLQFYIDAFMIYSTVEMKEILQIFEEIRSDRNTYKSTGTGILPGVSLQWTRGIFFARLNTGYELNTKASLRAKSGGSILSIDDDGGEIKTDWSGWRISLGIGLYL